MKETKFFMKRMIVKSDDSHNGMFWDYPLFIMFTKSDKDRIQRNYLEAQLNGISPDLRKSCMTSHCGEGFTYKELMEEVNKVPECSEEEFNTFLEIPHWNPFEKMDYVLNSYSGLIKEAKKESDKVMEENPELAKRITDFMTEVDDTTDLPKKKYSRELG